MHRHTRKNTCCNSARISFTALTRIFFFCLRSSSRASSAGVRRFACPATRTSGAQNFTPRAAPVARRSDAQSLPWFAQRLHLRGARPLSSRLRFCSQGACHGNHLEIQCRPKLGELLLPLPECGAERATLGNERTAPLIPSSCLEAKETEAVLQGRSLLHEGGTCRVLCDLTRQEIW